MIRLTRRQWLALPLEMKTRMNGTTPAVVAEQNGERRELPVFFVARVEDSQMKEAY